MDTALGLKAKSVIVFTDEIGWHTDELSREFTQRKINCTFIDLAKCNLMMKGCMANISFGEGNDYSPAAAFVRGISGGSLEQITKRLAILHCLASLKVPVINQPSAIEKSVDKGTTSFLLKKSGIPFKEGGIMKALNYLSQ